MPGARRRATLGVTRVLPGEEGPLAPQGGPHPRGVITEASPGAPSPGLAGPSPRGRPSEAKPWSWRLRRGAPSVIRETPGHVAGPGFGPVGSHLPSRAPWSKGEGAREIKFKRGLGCQHPEATNQKVAQVLLPAQHPPHPTPPRPRL